MTPTNITILTLSLLLAAMTVAFFRLRRRHRVTRHTLNRVAGERDDAIWDLHQHGLTLSRKPARPTPSGTATPAPGRLPTWPYA